MPLRSGIKPTTLPETQHRTLRIAAAEQGRTMLECLAEAVDRWAAGDQIVTPQLRYALDGISSDRKDEDMLAEIEGAWAGPPPKEDQ